MVDDAIEQIARFFYRRKGYDFPRNWSRQHPARVHFERVLERLRRENSSDAWMSYIEAQIHYSRDPSKLQPNMLYSKTAWNKFSWYWAKKKRRMGKVNSLELLTEAAVDGSVIFYAFADSAFAMESYVRGGFTELEAIVAFSHNMHPLFCAVAIWDDLVTGVRDGIPLAVLRSYLMLKKHRNLQGMKSLYASSRDKQRAAWRRRERLLAGFGPEDLPGGPEDIDAVNRALADGP